MKKNKWLVFIIVFIVVLLIATPVVFAPTHNQTNPTEKPNTNVIDEKPNQNPNNELEEINKDEKIDLSVYIPNVSKTTLHYTEVMDSGISMELQDIEKTNNSIKYIFLTFIEDGLGHIGVKGEDRTYYTIYEVTDTEIKEIIKNDMNEKGFERTILKTPLKEGSTWEDNFQHENKEYKGQYEIISVKDNEVTVKFTAKNVDGFYNGLYTEEYILEKGKSIVSLKRTLPWTENGKVVEAPFEFYRELHEIHTKGVQRTPYNTELDAYMPSEKSVYYYDGVAEYSHKLQLDYQRVNKGGDVKVYGFKGELFDGRGSENREFTVTYIIDNEGIREEIETTYGDFEETPFWSKHYLNSFRNYPIILKAPLKVGTEWDDIVVINDEVYEAKTAITNMVYNKKENRTEITTTTTAKVSPSLNYENNTYVEKRVFAEGVGLISFSKNNPGVKIDNQTEYYEFEYSLTRIENK